MKRAYIVTIFGAALLIAVVTLFAQKSPVTPTKEIMRQKLDHAESVLEGITLENFEMIEAHAKKLSALSQNPSWNVFDSQEYAQQSALFRRTIEGLSKAAKEHNVDGAVLAYTKVTFSCVECHKYVRGRKLASASPSLEPF